jgi:uncharacterized membrane protein YcaP (DUF421 family)
LMLGEVVDEIIYGDVTFLQGMTAVAVIAVAQYLTGWLTFTSRTADKVLEGKPTIVVRDGEPQKSAMRAERINEEELMALLRVQGIDDLREVKLAIIEVGGELSVLKQSWAEPLQKADLGGQHGKHRDAVFNGEEKPPTEKQTDSPSALMQSP